jgi:SAM-dependent methyltransferase
MVHALDEIRRVLKPGGVLLDIRPMEVRWPIEVAWSDGFIEAGGLLEVPSYQADHQAATQAIEESGARGWFSREEQDIFPLFYYWDTPSEMKEEIEEEWEKPEQLGEEDYRKAQSAWATANADARVRVRVKVMIARWRTPTRPPPNATYKAP